MSSVRIPQLTPAIGIDGTEEVEIAVLISPGNYESRRTTTGAIAGASLPSGVTPGTYGDSSHVGQFTVDTFGKLTFAGNVAMAGGGTVSSVAMTVPTGLSVSGSPITSSGTLAVTWTSGTTGSGANVFATSPALVTPDLGVPSAAVLTNATGLPISSGVSGLGAGVATFLGTPSSANLAAAVTDETGSGALVFATSPVLVTPNLGTPSAGVLTNATGLPITAGTTGMLAETRGGTNQTTYTTGDLLYASGANTLAKRGIGTSGDVLTVSGGVPTWVAPGSGGTVTSVSVVTANGFAGSVSSPTATPAITISTTITGILQGNGTAISAASTTGSGDVVLATSPTLVTPALGIPTALVLTNATGLPVAQLTGTGTGILTWLATPSSANLAAAVTDETGSGLLVFATSPTLTTPVLGVATATSINKVAITAPATSATLTIPDGVTMTGPATSGTVMTLGNAETVTGAKTFNNNKLLFAGSTSGTITLNATAIAGSNTLTLPAATDTLVGQATTDTLTNKTINGSNNTITNVSLTSGVTGTLPTANGGTNLTTFTAANNAIYSTSSSALAAGTLPRAAGGTASTTGAFIKINIQKFIASGTYTPTPGILYAIIECWGGGGSGGSVDGQSSVVVAGAGGGGGSYSRVVASSSTIGASQTVTVGAGGTAPSSGANNGNAGSDTSVGTICIGKGGSGGQYTQVGAQVGFGGAGGVAGTGDFTLVGGDGFSGTISGSNANGYPGGGGYGGASPSGGGTQRPGNSGGTGANGSTGHAFGGGGSGAISLDTSNFAGGAGGVGGVIITEYLNQ